MADREEWKIEDGTAYQMELWSPEGNAEYHDIPKGHLTVYQVAQIMLLEAINKALADIAYQLQHLSADTPTHHDSEAKAFRVTDRGV